MRATDWTDVVRVLALASRSSGELIAAGSKATMSSANISSARNDSKADPIKISATSAMNARRCDRDEIEIVSQWVDPQTAEPRDRPRYLEAVECTVYQRGG
jgi:hypothetical protein